MPETEFMAPCVGDMCIGCGWQCQTLEGYKRPAWADKFPELKTKAMASRLPG